MSWRTGKLAPRIRGLVALACLLAAIAAVAQREAPAGADAGAAGPLVAQPVLGAPGTRVLGSSPGEAAGETWGISNQTISRYTDADGWQPQPPPVGADGQPIPGLDLAGGALDGRSTPAGGVVITGQSRIGTTNNQVLVVRDPGGPFHAAPDASGALDPGETLFAGNGGPPLLVPVDETGGHTGVLLVPAEPGAVAPDGVLYLDGSGTWSREPICVGAQPAPCHAPSPGFQVLAIDASSPGNAWLLAKGSAQNDGIVLLSRDLSGGSPVWRQRFLVGQPGSLSDDWSQASPPVAPGPPPTSVHIAARTLGQPLTVTAANVWVDARLTIQGTTQVDATLRYVPDANGSGGHVAASWCDVPTALAALCSHPLGTELPAGDGRSFAWDDGSVNGQRVITGETGGAILILQGETFTRMPTAGSDAGGSFGAGFGAPDDGWLGAGGEPIHITRHPEPDKLQAWPVPFRRPLTAIAPQPGVPVAAIGSQALAVGDNGEVARYTPGKGWAPEFLLSASGARATPRLRGGAWPEPDRAYAVGDNAEMWLWRRETGLWQPDPGKPPNLVRANFTGIAFDPGDSSRGYAIGKQGVLLRYDKQWTPDALPAGLDPRVNFTSIAFAGHEALVTYKLPQDSSGYTGGVIANDGSGWRVDADAAAALDGDAPERVAALPDGGAVIAAMDGRVVERDGPSAPWQAATSEPIGFPVALAAVRQDGHVRAAMSIEFGGVSSPGADWRVDSEELYDQPPPGQAPLLTDPYPLGSEGYLLLQTATGWQDEEHEAYPRPDATGSQVDWPLRPDAVLALLLDPSGEHGWAVGGETGELSNQLGDTVQTAGVMRYPADAAPPANTSPAPIATDAGTATFAIGGNAQCAAACADLSNTRIGPEAWLPVAVGTAAQIAGLRAFLYSGPGVADGLGSTLDPLAYARESARYATRLGSAAGSLPVFPAPATSDLDGSGSLATFARSFAGFDAPLGSAAGAGIASVAPLAAGHGYAFDSSGTGGSVRVIVLDYSATTLGATQRCWLAGQLAAAGTAGTPAIVVGNRDVSAAQGSPNAAADGDAVIPILVSGAPPAGCTVAGTPSGASAYFFDYPEQNRTYAITSGGRSIPTFGSGTLGYVDAPLPSQTDFVGASGFLLASVDVAQRDPSTNVAPVSTRLIPSISDLALDATDGTLLRRSQPALFDALARRPEAGMRCSSYPSCTFSPDPYIPIPNQCQGSNCASGLFPTYSFSSSRPDIADFVKADPASTNPRHVLLDGNDQPIPDAASGLLCAFNAGTTTVTITAGGLSYSEPITVQAGSVERPCGTVPLRDRPVPVPAPPPPPPPAPEPQPQIQGGSTPLVPPPPVHVVPKPAHHPVPHPAPLAAPAFVAAAPGLTQIIPVVPPPAPAAARPTPPSGTAPVQVYQSAVAPERQREEQAALDLVHNMVVSRPVDDGATVPPYLPALILLLAAGGGAAHRSRRRRGLARAYAYARERSSR
jgi:hypothetical protein